MSLPRDDSDTKSRPSDQSVPSESRPRLAGRVVTILGAIASILTIIDFGNNHFLSRFLIGSRNWSAQGPVSIRQVPAQGSGYETVQSVEAEDSPGIERNAPEASPGKSEGVISRPTPIEAPESGKVAVNRNTVLGAPQEIAEGSPLYLSELQVTLAAQFHVESGVEFVTIVATTSDGKVQRKPAMDPGAILTLSAQGHLIALSVVNIHWDTHTVSVVLGSGSSTGRK